MSESRYLVDANGQPIALANPLPVTLAGVSGGGLATETTLAALSAKVPSALGPATPSLSLSLVAAQSLPVCWQVPVSTGARALAIAWVKNVATSVGWAVTNDSGKLYVCRTAGTTQNTDNAGPTGTSADVTDGSAHWSYVAASATAFKGSIVLTNTSTSVTVYYSTSAALALGGAAIPINGGQKAIFYGDATAIFVYAASAVTLTVEAYP